MLLDSKLPNSFWGEAISTAVYLKNRTPVKTLNKTPFEVCHGKKPKVNYLRVFGSDAYAHVPRDERTNLLRRYESVSWWDTEMLPKGTDCMMPQNRKQSIVVIFNLMKILNNVDRIPTIILRVIIR